ncbi:MAG: hypothetical protein ACHQK8_05470, partial [Bacteroidia bacterium]
MTVLFFALLLHANGFTQKIYFTTNVNGFVFSVNSTSDRNYLAFGYATNSSLAHNSISKLDRKGNLLWQKFIFDYDSVFFQSPYRIISSKNGFLVPMYYFSNGYGISSDSFLLVNINQDGNVIWQKNILNKEFVAGNFFVENDNTISTIKIDKNNKPLLEKMDSIGNIFYSKSVQNLFISRAMWLRKTSAGTYVFSTIDTNIYKLRNCKKTITCIDTPGNILWNKILNYNDTLSPV